MTANMHEHADHEFYMTECIKLARLAKQRGDSPVGSVIVQNGIVIGQGIEGSRAMKDITFHAEIEAVRQAIKRLEMNDLSDCFLYTTHEPCIMCSYVIRHHRINTVVFGLTTEEVGGYSSAHPLLLDKTITRWGPPPLIIKGVSKRACLSLHN